MKSWEKSKIDLISESQVSYRLGIFVYIIPRWNRVLPVREEDRGASVERPDARFSPRVWIYNTEIAKLRKQNFYRFVLGTITGL